LSIVQVVKKVFNMTALQLL